MSTKNCRKGKEFAFKQTLEIASRFLKGLDSPYSLHLETLLSKGAYREFYDACKGFTPHTHAELYDDFRSFFTDYSASSVLSKYGNLPGVSEDKAAVAIQKFVDSETRCRETNRRFSSLSIGSSHPLWAWQILKAARKNIESCLGEFSWDSAVLRMDFGPGASVGLPRRRSHRLYKFGHLRPTTTGECAVLASHLFEWLPQWRIASDTSDMVRPTMEIVAGSSITTVPKNAETDRVIAIEPLLNMFCQKGIGGVIRSSLRRVGINLNDQTRNQELAKAGSTDGSLATIDLSAASDSIASSLVEMLLPERWVTAMKICRSPVCVLPDGTVHRLEKFSSMGNGYTFELESLIFWAIAKACCAHLGIGVTSVSVYGDDIIVPVEAVELLIDALSYVGFKTNVSKSFWSGSFRESCGKHFWRGCDVTPMYVKDDVHTVEELLWAANATKRLSYRLHGIGYGCDSRLFDTWSYIVSKLPPSVAKLSIPEGFGDGALVRDLDEARPTRHRFMDAWKVRLLTRLYHTVRPGGQPALMLSLFTRERRKPRAAHYLDRLPYHTLSGGGKALYGRIQLGRVLKEHGVKRKDAPEGVQTGSFRVAIVKSYVSQWDGLGPWSSWF